MGVHIFSSSKKNLVVCFGGKFLNNAKAVLFATKREEAKANNTISIKQRAVVNWPIVLPPDLDINKVAIRIKYGLPIHKRLLICFGRLHPMKRPLDLIQVFNSLDRTDVCLVLLGPDDLLTLGQCRDLASRRENPSVFCIPAQYGSELQELVQSCDGYISWSWRENFNYCLAESLGAGLPVIVSKGNDLGSELVGLGCGWILSDDSEDSLVTAIHSFANLPYHYLKLMGVRAQSFAKSRFSFATFTRNLLALTSNV